MQYGKIANSQLIFMRQPLKIESVDTFTNDDAVIRSQGWKPVVYTDMPQQDGFYATDEWIETVDAITQVWTLHEMPADPDPTYEELMEAYKIATGGGPA